MVALGLAFVTLGYWMVLRKPLGVSGSWARVILWYQDKEVEEAERPFRDKPKMLMDALMQATIDEFGKQAVLNAIEQRRGQQVDLVTEQAGQVENLMPSRVPWTSHIVFLVMLVFGGALSTFLTTGNVNISHNLGELHVSIFGTGFSYILSLFVGGVMVGFGTQLGGGCTSGHGLSGVSRLVPASLIATVAFFATAVVVSFMLKQ